MRSKVLLIKAKVTKHLTPEHSLDDGSGVSQARARRFGFGQVTHQIFINRAATPPDLRVGVRRRLQVGLSCTLGRV